MRSEPRTRLVKAIAQSDHGSISSRAAKLPRQMRLLRARDAAFVRSTGV
jgi:hypothetical protein